MRQIFACFLVATIIGGVATTEAHACVQRELTQETGPGPHDYTVATASPKLWRKGDPGEPLYLRLRVMDRCGKPVEGASVQVLHANNEGFHEAGKFRGVYKTNRRGAVNLLTVFPGYTGGIPRHIHFIVKSGSHRELVTRLFFKNDPDLDMEIEDLAMVLEEVHHGGVKGWAAGFEFVLGDNE